MIFKIHFKKINEYTNLPNGRDLFMPVRSSTRGNKYVIHYLNQNVLSNKFSTIYISLKDY